jgi:hypothetical protein
MEARVGNGIIASSLALYVTWAVGCASAPEPTERLATAKAGVHSARELGASSVPQAALHVKLAEEEIQRANKLIADGENERARALLDRAAADAELAVALAREKRVRDSADANAKLQADKQNP